MGYRDSETAQRRSRFHQRIQIDFPGQPFVVDLQSYFRSLLGDAHACSLRWRGPLATLCQYLDRLHTRSGAHSNVIRPCTWTHA
ncbi:hypothetical protein EBA01_01150 [Xanthomonas oryzae pv. oryzae]|nr:hypothetical protein BVV16_01170 [Xanthomonas oryzae pv. oryzae]AUI92847.1 hypothetical protein BVV17_01170 [Xanthomonas oryzae pv. oryzae]AUI96520.1 hypothetical protein BVV18_01175 [Xanthomonas oryzae pv. oryzae]AUJ00191.1 hypothetical protein BVV10_01170 [Xanthomonas oryzae pv. oryzae]AUJ03871.1 hypothetical protein BVV19_01175 [Xanthomonas oryzae pv. oryzae]